MEYVVLGWPPDGPKLRLDYRRFAYAGKFVMTNTGKAIVRDEERPPPSISGGCPEPEDCRTDVLAAVAFNADRTEASALWFRYVTVRADLRGHGLGPQLCAYLVDRASDRGYDLVRIAVNNPFAYEALYRAGFAWTGEQTGLAELLLERPAVEPAERDPDRYQRGFEVYRERYLGEPEASFLDRRRDEPPPPVVEWSAPEV